MLAPSLRPNKNFTVPSLDSARRKILSPLMEKFSSNASRRPRDKLVISAKAAARLRCGTGDCRHATTV
jgi:hypothetical protein